MTARTTAMPCYKPMDLAKLAMNRIADKWSMPKCCCGACRGRGVPEALYTVKHCAQEVGGLQDATVFLQLDVSSAFDSLKLQAILAFFRFNSQKLQTATVGPVTFPIAVSAFRYHLGHTARGRDSTGSHALPHSLWSHCCSPLR